MGLPGDGHLRSYLRPHHAGDLPGSSQHRVRLAERLANAWHPLYRVNAGYAPNCSLHRASRGSLKERGAFHRTEALACSTALPWLPAVLRCPRFSRSVHPCLASARRSCVELKPGKGAQIARSAGTSVQLVAKEGQYCTLRLRSGEMRRVLSDCRATLGEVSNSEHNLRSLGKAGAKRWRGVRPTVRGVVMNPVDHPHGGGEGKTSGGRHPVSPWGMPTKGYKTRRNKRTDKMIVRRRRSSR